MATLTETIAGELLDSLDDPDGIERVMTQHRGSKGPLYGGLARATLWLHHHVQELNDRAGRLKADNETLGENVATLAQKRGTLEREVGRLENRVDQASDRLKETEQLISRAESRFDSDNLLGVYRQCLRLDWGILDSFGGTTLRDPGF